MKIFPVIVPISPLPKETVGRKKVDHLRKISRKALRVSAHLSGINLQKLEKDSNGAPIPFGNIYWSVSHTSLFAAAVLGDYPIGIDIEKIKPRNDAVIEKVISEEESKLCKEEKLHHFFRVWTAKEAVLKAKTVGLAGLGKCRVVDVPDKVTMIVDYEGKEYAVTQTFIDGHVASITNNDNISIEWIVAESEI